MRRKAFLMSLFILAFVLPANGFTAENTEAGTFKRVLKSEMRGLTNVGTFWMEIFRTARLEKQKHPKAWPVTFFPRSVTNMVLRLSSAVNDIAFYPFAAPFHSDITPWTRPMGLPDYPWKNDEGSF